MELSTVELVLITFNDGQTADNLTIVGSMDKQLIRIEIGSLGLAIPLHTGYMNKHVVKQTRD